jgi:energy-coupling factor transporter transmembrane protein EcfT
VVASAVAAAIVSAEPWALLLSYALLALAAATCRLPVRALVLTSLLPVPLVGLFALSRWNGHVDGPLAIVSKGMLTALAGLLVASTTPYPELLAPATRVLPTVLSDSLVLTYRALFILWARLDALWLAIRARGGFFRKPRAGTLPWAAAGTTWRRRAGVAATGTAIAVLRGVDLSGRLYDVMRLRGYQGRLAPDVALRPTLRDWPAVLLSLALVGTAGVFRTAGF